MMKQAAARKPTTRHHPIRHAKQSVRDKENANPGKVFGAEGKKEAKKHGEKTFGVREEKHQRAALQDRTNGLKRKSENALSRGRVYHQNQKV